MKTTTFFRTIFLAIACVVFINISGNSKGSWSMNPVSVIYHADSILVSSTKDGNTKLTYTYDADHNLITLLKQLEAARGWENLQMDTYAYDEYGHLLTDTYQEWNGTEWMNMNLYTSSYDEYGNLLTVLQQNWEEVDWMNSMLFTNTYDEFGKKLGFIAQYWESDTWVNSDMSLYTYDDNGYLIIDLYHYWDGINWVEMSRTLYTYDDSGRKLTQLEQYWDGEWFDAMLFTNTYDGYGNWISYLGQQWTGEEWWNMSAATMTYDMDGNCLSRIDQFWVGVDWQNTGKNEYEYQAGLIIGHGFIWEADQWITGDSYMFQIGVNIEGEKQIFYTTRASLVHVYYSGFGVGIPEMNKEQSFMFSVYPNPAKESMTITPEINRSEWVSIRLFDLSGRNVHVLYDGIMQTGAQITVNTNELPNGLYILEVRAGTSSSRQKVSIIR